MKNETKSEVWPLGWFASICFEGKLSVSVGDACKDSKARQKTTSQEVAIVKMKSSHVADDWVNETDINNTLCVWYVHYDGGPHNI